MSFPLFKTPANEGEKNKLIVKHTPLVVSVIQKKFPNARDRDDLIQEGLLALSKAIDTYQESRGSFSNWATTCVIRRGLDYVLRKSPMIKRGEIVSIEAINDLQAPLSANLELVEIVGGFDADLCDKIIEGKPKTKRDRIKIKRLRRLLIQKYPEFCGKNQ